MYKLIDRSLIVLIAGIVLSFSNVVVSQPTARIHSVKKLYTDLLSFKDEPVFHAYGFSVASPYREWYERCASLQKDKELFYYLLKKGVVVGDICILGQEYINSKGKETDYSKIIRKELDSALSGLR